MPSGREKLEQEGVLPKSTRETDKEEAIDVEYDMVPVEVPEEMEDEVFNIVEQMPAFPGCENESGQELRECSTEKTVAFVGKNIKYPEICREQNIQGKVFIGYVIDQAGRVSDAMVIRGAHPVLDQEALRVVKSLPRHRPGTQRGKPVSVRFTLPVSFKL